MIDKLPKWTYGQALELAMKQVEKVGPEYTYPSVSDGLCVYFNTDGRPSCIVGHMLSDDHVDSSLFVDESGNRQIINTSEVVVLGVFADERAAAFLSSLQMHQDKGATWAEALRLAILESDPDRCPERFSEEFLAEWDANKL